MQFFVVPCSDVEAYTAHQTRGFLKKTYSRYQQSTLSCVCQVFFSAIAR